MKRAPVLMRASLTVLALAFFAACASTPDLPPKSGPEEVELYNINAGQYPPDGYEIIGTVTAEAIIGTPTGDLQLQLRREAARLGADGVIFDGVRSSTAGGSNMSDREEMLIAEGRAIYWPEGMPDS